MLMETRSSLQKKIFKDLKECTGISKDSERLLQIQGRVFDGQYLCEPFTKHMNQPIIELLGKDPFMCSELCWSLQWDPAHLIDIVFTAHKEDKFISRLIQRTNLIHNTFNYGKMHSLAKATAEELQLPFRVTVSFAPASEVAVPSNS